VQVGQLVLGGLQAAGGDAVLPLQQGDDGGDGFEVAALEQLLQEAAQLGDARPGALAPVQAAVQAALQFGDVGGLPLGDGRPEVLVGPEDRVLAIADPARGDRARNGGKGWEKEKERDSEKGRRPPCWGSAGP
jgi:hypothetical protein